MRNFQLSALMLIVALTFFQHSHKPRSRARTLKLKTPSCARRLSRRSSRWRVSSTHCNRRRIGAHRREYRRLALETRRDEGRAPCSSWSRTTSSVSPDDPENQHDAKEMQTFLVCF
jgi:hypothetical protein